MLLCIGFVWKPAFKTNPLVFARFIQHTHPRTKTCERARQRGASHLSRFRGTGDAERLVAESEQILREVGSTLFRLLKVQPGPGSSLSLLNSAPVVNLAFSPLAPRQFMVDAGSPLKLNAFAILAEHSQRLDGFPELKRAFWMDVLSSRAIKSARDAHACSFSDAESPRFNIHFSHYQHLCEVDEALTEVIYTFMTTPAATQTQQQQSELENPVQSMCKTNQVVAFGLSFARCNLTAASLERIERLLDRVFAHPDRQYDVNMLDFSGNTMDDAALAVLTRIVKEKSIYQIKELKLNEIIPDIAASDWGVPDETPSEFLDIMRVVFDVHQIPRLRSYPLEPIANLQNQPSQLLRASMRGNYLCPRYFAAYYSALRYGCSIAEDVSGYTAKESVYGEDTTEEKIEYWRWVAFGLFYPRPKRFASAFKLRNIGRLECNPAAAATFAKVMRNPAVELVDHGKTSEDSDSVATELMVCTLKNNASIEMFESGFKSTRTDLVEERCELEALCVREDGSVCVVVPGVGLGWVQAAFVECVEREPLDASRTEQDGWYDVELGVGWESQSFEGVMAVIETVGPQMHSLSLHRCQLQQGFAQCVLEHCTNLQQLSLSTSHIDASDCDVLINALRGSLGSRLLSLNLNGNFQATDTRTRNLIAALAINSVLRELRLHGAAFGAQELASLHEALRVNRTLELLELAGRAEHLTNLDPDDVTRERSRLDTECQGQVLQSSFPMETKLAFLSTMMKNQRGEASARSLLDSWSLSLTFAFAASCGVKRKIAWNVDFESGYY